jgi:hypothetical protein
MKAFDADLLLPKPRHLTLSTGRADLTGLRAWCACGSPVGDEAARLAAGLQEVLGRHLARLESPGAATVVLDVDGRGAAGHGPESYVLEIQKGGVVIRGATARAVFWGIQTLRQVIEAAGGAKAVPCLAIRDWPLFEFRGLSDDMSRRQISTLEDLEFMVCQFARFKLNVYQPYMEDILFIDKHPLAGLGSGRLTRDEVAHLVDVGRNHFVDIMPQFNSVSHQEHLLALPKYNSLSYRGNRENLDPDNPGTRAYLSDVWEQIFEMFPSHYVHVGLDEARGLSERPDLFLKQANWLAELATRAGRRPIMWHDMFAPRDEPDSKFSPTLLDRLDRRIVLDVWVYQMPDPWAAFLEEAAKRGFETLLSPFIRSRLCGAARRDWRAASELLDFGRKLDGVLGMLNTTWNDHGISTDRFLNWRGHAMSAEMSWHGPAPEKEVARVARAFDAQFYGVTDARRSTELDQVIEFAAENTAYGIAATRLPLHLAQRGNPALEKKAKAVAAKVDVLHEVVVDFQKAATRHRLQLDHARLGLARLAMGAIRCASAPQLQRAIASGSPKAVWEILTPQQEGLAILRENHELLWLRRYKPEGLEYLDYYYRSALAAMEGLPYLVHHESERFDTVMGEGGWSPVDLSAAANGSPRELGALLQGERVIDNVPWFLLRPDAKTGNAMVWTGSKPLPEYSKKVTIVVGREAAEIHFLHAVYGRPKKAPITYRLVFDDGKTQAIAPRPGLDIADWWMPFGHDFGGGGALGLDSANCRLACLTDPEHIQGHGLYHFWKKVSRPGKVIERIEIEATDENASLVLAAVTLRTKAQ